MIFELAHPVLTRYITFMPANAELDDLLASLTDALRTALLRAYEQGFDVGKREAADVLKSQVLGLIEGAFPRQGDVVGAATRGFTSSAPVASETDPQRAAPGSIKPAILAAVREAGAMRPADIASATGIKENTVRGTLRSLSLEGKVEKVNGLWVLSHGSVGKENPGADTPGKTVEDQI